MFEFSFGAFWNLFYHQTSKWIYKIMSALYYEISDKSWIFQLWNTSVSYHADNFLLQHKLVSIIILFLNIIRYEEGSQLTIQPSSMLVGLENLI